LNAAGEKPLLHGTNHAAAAFFIFEFFLLMAGKLYSPLFIHLKRKHGFFWQSIIFAIQQIPDHPFCKNIGNHGIPVGKPDNRPCAVFKIE
jgi:hypothetical protein